MSLSGQKSSTICRTTKSTVKKDREDVVREPDDMEDGEDTDTAPTDADMDQLDDIEDMEADDFDDDEDENLLDDADDDDDDDLDLDLDIDDDADTAQLEPVGMSRTWWDAEDVNQPAIW